MSEPRVPVLAQAIEAGVLARLCNPSQIKVFSIIAKHADYESREAWPGAPRIAELAGIDRSTVFKAVRSLEKNGLLKVLTRGGGRLSNGQPASNRYFIPYFQPSANRCAAQSSNSGGSATVNDGQPTTVNRGQSATVKGGRSTFNSGQLATVNHGGPATQISKKISKGTFKNNARSGLPLSSNRTTRAETIYLAYPRRVGKRAALTAIERAAKRLADAGHADPWGHLFERTSTFANSPAGQPPPRGSPDFRPYPTTFFNSDRFDDDPGEWNRLNVTTSSIHPHEAGGCVAAPAGKYADAGRVIDV